MTVPPSRSPAYYEAAREVLPDEARDRLRSQEVRLRVGMGISGLDDQIRRDVAVEHGEEVQMRDAGVAPEPVELLVEREESILRSQQLEQRECDDHEVAPCARHRSRSSSRSFRWTSHKSDA